MIPRFLLQIVDADDPHAVVRFPAGGPLERDFIDACRQAIVAKGVGFGKTEAQVDRAIMDGLTDVIKALKWETRQLPRV